MGVVSQTFSVKGDRSGGITKTISQSRISKDDMQAWDFKTLWLCDFKRSWRLDL